MNEQTGCGDNSCIFKALRAPGGMGTNGGCRCFKGLISWNEEAKHSNRDEVRHVEHLTRRLAQMQRANRREADLLASEVKRLREEVELLRIRLRIASEQRDGWRRETERLARSIEQTAWDQRDACANHLTSDGRLVSHDWVCLVLSTPLVTEGDK